MNIEIPIPAHQQGTELFLEAKLTLDVIYSSLEVIRPRYRLYGRNNWMVSLNRVDDGDRYMILD
jgi:hypothetical protein